MNMYDSLFSPSCVLNEQVARQMFEVLPEADLVIAIVDKDGHYWPSDSEKFHQLNINDSFLKELCAKIDDGNEPVITQVDDCSVIAAQLATERTNCGYALIAMPRYSPESTLANIDLVEVILSQVNVIAKLIEKNDLLYEFQLKQLSPSVGNEAGSRKE